MKFKFSFLVMCMFFSFYTYAQVKTYTLSEERMEDIIPYYDLHSEKASSSYIVPPVNIERVLEDDKRKNRKLHRFGIKVKSNYTETDGQFIDLGEITIWKISFKAPSANSLNFEFTNLNLPEGSSMYLYDGKEQMVIGPITSKNINNNKFSSDLVLGDECIIVVNLLSKNKKKFSININNIIHGFRSPYRGYQSSLPCNTNIICSAGANFTKEKEAVLEIFVDNTFSCSGFLVNNACQDLKPFVLTAFHCLDINLNGVLSQAEKDNTQNYVFRFGYESPTCIDSEPSPASLTSFSGATFRSAWIGSDFALLELNSSVIGHGDLSFIGWDRSSSLPSSTTIIHHPKGDVKKISIDSDSPTLACLCDEDPYWSNSAQNAALELLIRDGVAGDVGYLESGSSGSLALNENKRMVGIFVGGNTDTCTTETLRYHVGRFFSSWTGGGTNDTRLSNWLGGSSNPMTLNTIRVSHISGVKDVCTSNRIYNLLNSIPGKTVSWSVSPTNLFATSGGASTSGNSTVAILRAKSNKSSGAATLTYTLSSSGCTPVTVTKSIWVGKPKKPFTNPFGSPVINMALGDRLTVFTTNSSNSGANNATWEDFGSLSRIGGASGLLFKKFDAILFGTGNWTVKNTNTCGNSFQNAGAVFVQGICNPCPRVVFSPNPTRDYITIDIPYEILNSNPIKGGEGRIVLYDATGRAVVLRERNLNEQETIDLSSFPKGLYLLEVSFGNERYQEKIMIIK